MNKIWIPILIVPCLLCGCKKDEAAAAPSDSAAPKMSASATPSADASATPATTPEASPSGAAVGADKVVGTWKVDIAKTTIPAKDDKEKAEEVGMRVEIKADGTYATSGTATVDTGKWTIEGDKLMLKNDKATGSAPPAMTIAPDGSSLSVDVPGGEGKTFTLVMIKA